MLSQPQTRTLVNSCEYFYLTTSSEEFNQNLEEHSWGYGISLRSRDSSKILADGTYVLSSVIGKCVAITFILAPRALLTAPSTPFYTTVFFTNGENGSLPVENSFLSPQFISALCWIIVGDFSCHHISHSGSKDSIHLLSKEPISKVTFLIWMCPMKESSCSPDSAQLNYSWGL